MAGAHRIGTRTDGADRDRPPPKFFLPIGAACFAINHLSVVLGNGVQPEALMIGCWLVLMGGWVLAAGWSFDAVWARVKPSDRWTIAFVLLSLGASYGAAEAVARFGYGQPLLG